MNIFIKSISQFTILFVIFVSFDAIPENNPRNREGKINIGIPDALAIRYPERHGIVWPFEVVYEIYQIAGLEVTHTLLPSKRLNRALTNDEIDTLLASGIASETRNPFFLPSTLPVAVTTWYIYYDRSHWQPTWPPDEKFRSKIGKSLSAKAIKADWGLTITESPEVSAIIKMINQGRADYWLTDPAPFWSLDKDLLRSDSDFVFESLFNRPTFMYFQNNDRGKQLRKIYDAGYRQLLESGRLKQVYYRNDPNYKQSTSVEDALEYLRQNHPDLRVPVQLPVAE